MNVSLNQISQNNSFHSYLIGQSAQNILFRLTLIFVVQLFIWIFVILASIVHLYKQNQKRLQQHTRLYNQVEMQRRHELARHCRINSSSTSIASRKWYSFYRKFPSFRSMKSSSLMEEAYPHSNPSLSNSVKVQAVIEAMTRRSFNSSQKSIRERDSLSLSPERERKTLIQQTEICRPVRQMTLSAYLMQSQFYSSQIHRLTSRVLVQ